MVGNLNPQVTFIMTVILEEGEELKEPYLQINHH